MNLIDILNQIYFTKNEIRDILDENYNIAKYPISIHNLLAKRYNDGYAAGYHDKYEELTGIESWPDAQKEYLEYVVNDDTEYDPFSVDGLTDIMSDVLGYRIQMRDELEIETDYFPSYPDYLRSAIDLVYNTAYSNGEADANDAVLPLEPVSKPIPHFEDNVFSLSTDQPEARCFFTVDSSDSVATRYESPITIGSTVTFNYYAKIGSSRSESDTITCVYTSTGLVPVGDDVVSSGQIRKDNNNIVYIDKTNENDVVYYKVDSGDWVIYTGPITIPDDGEEHTVETYSVRNNVMSAPTSETYEYEEDPSEVLPTCSYPTFEQDDTNTITLSCETTGAQIYYRIGASGDYTLYSSPFTISESCDLYCYSSKTDYNDSNTRIYSIAYIVTVVPPEMPQFYMVDENVSCNLHVWTPTASAHIWWRYGNVGDWNEVEYNHANLYPSDDCTVYAYADLGDDNISDVAVYEYNWYSKINNLPTPALTMINNRVYITVEEGTQYHEIKYTLDGSDPRGGQLYFLQNNRSPIVINEPNTVVKARINYVDDNHMQHWSDIITGIFSPVFDESFDFSAEYFTVLGASEIHLSDVPVYAGDVMNWSYDKSNWYSFSNAVTGLDREKRVYLKIYGTNSFRMWNTMTFGEGDQVTVSGNIMSTIWADSYEDYVEVDYEQVFKGMFKDCVQLVDASDLTIPVTNSLGSDFKEMFMGCVNLTAAPQVKIEVHDLAKYACQRMFAGCTSLVKGPKFEFSTLADNACEEMFLDCTSLQKVGDFNISTIGKQSLKKAFYNCSSLPSVEMQINGDMKEESCYQTFYGCSELIACDQVSSMASIEHIQINSSVVAKNCCYQMFMNCGNIGIFGTLPASVGAWGCYQEMFKNCTSLYKFGTLGLTEAPGNTQYIMFGMFEGCTSLTTAPVIQMHSIQNLTYSLHRMFYGCSSLNYIKALFLTDPMVMVQQEARWPYTENWVYGVADSGVFEQDADAQWFHLGVSAIPERWAAAQSANIAGNITSISCHYDKVTILASNDNAIYYQLNDTDGEWILYTGPFQIFNNCTVYAKCLSNRGTWGNVRSQWLTIDVPKISIAVDNAVVALSWPEDYDYEQVFYQILTPGSYNVVQDWTLYEEPFNVDMSCRISARGLKANGEYGPKSYIDYTYHIGAPSLTCVDNVVRIRQDGEYEYIEYKIDNEASWHRYSEPFVISQTCDITVCSVSKDRTGSYVYSDEATYNCIYSASGQSYILHIPTFTSKDSNHKNVLICKYDGNAFSIPEGIHVKYRENGGTWKDWTFDGTYANQIVISADTTIETYAYDENGAQSDTATYTFEYDSSQPAVTVPNPTFTVEYTGLTQVFVGISNTMSGVETFFKVTGFTLGNHYDTWRYSKPGNGPYFTNPVPDFRVYAYSTYNGYNSEIVYIDVEGTESGEVHVAAPSISFNPNTNVVSITGVAAGTIYYGIGNRIWIEYTGPFELYSSNTIYAYTKLGNYSSSETRKYCEITQITVSASINNNIITITCNIPNASIYYSTESSEGPYELYVNTIPILEDTDIWIYAVSGDLESSIVHYEFEYDDIEGFILNWDTSTMTITTNKNADFEWYLRKDTRGSISTAPSMQANVVNTVSGMKTTVWDTSYTYTASGTSATITLSDEHTAAYLTAYINGESVFTQLYRNPTPQISMSYITRNTTGVRAHTSYYPSAIINNWIIPAWTWNMGNSEGNYNYDIFYMYRWENGSYISDWKSFKSNSSTDYFVTDIMEQYSGYTLATYPITSWQPYGIYTYTYNIGKYDWFKINNNKPLLGESITAMGDKVFYSYGNTVSYQFNYYKPSTPELSYIVGQDYTQLSFTYDINPNTDFKFALWRQQQVPGHVGTSTYYYRSDGTWENYDNISEGDEWVILNDSHSLLVESSYDYSVDSYYGIPTVMLGVTTIPKYQ